MPSVKRERNLLFSVAAEMKYDIYNRWRR